MTTTEKDRHENFVRLLMTVQKPLWGFVNAHVHDANLTDDIVQEVSVILWRKHDQYDPNCSFLGWAFGIARFQVLSANRQSARSRLVFDDDMVEKLADCYEESEPDLEKRRTVLDACMKGLPAKARALVDMRYGQAMCLETVAKNIGKSLTAVTAALSRIRTALRECVDRYSEAEPDMAGGPS